MAIRIQTQATPFASYTNVDPTTSLMGNFKLTVSVSHPTQLTWTAYAPQHEMPFTPGHLIRIWDDAANDPSGTAFSSSNPIFEGHIQVPKPGADTYTVEYTAYDPTYRSQSHVTVMSTAWSAGTVPGTPPVEGTGAYPRLVVNATAIQNDDDVAFSRAENQTIESLIKLIFDDQYHPLYWISAAPGDGTSAGNGSAYVSADLTSMTYEPQEKMVFESESVLSAVNRLLQQNEPNYRLLWRPGTRKWRFFDISAAPATTVTLNDFSGSNKVLSMTLDRSIEGRYSAVKFYGPELLQPAEFRTDDGTLNELLDYGVILEYVGLAEIKSYTRFQIADPAKRRIGRILPGEIPVGVGGPHFITVRATTLQCSYDDGNSWATVLGAYFDFQNGIAFTGDTTPPWIYNSAGQVVTTGIQHYFPPTTVRIITAYYDVPISTRYPSSGFSGTASTVGNYNNELKLYDEMLATDYTWYGTPVTTVERLLKFNALAQRLHAERKDIIYVGGMTFEGLEWGWLWLNKRVNIAGKDANGGTLTTGLESIGAMVTDVEYDFETKLTTIQFSSDQMALMGVNVELTKKQLKIMALQAQQIYSFYTNATVVRRYTQWGTPFLMGNWTSHATRRTVYIDPRTGKIEESL